MYITENGTSFIDAVENGLVHDPLSASFLEGYMEAAAQAIRDGVNLHSYSSGCWWITSSGTAVFQNASGWFMSIPPPSKRSSKTMALGCQSDQQSGVLLQLIFNLRVNA